MSKKCENWSPPWIVGAWLRVKFLTIRRRRVWGIYVCFFPYSPIMFKVLSERNRRRLAQFSKEKKGEPTLPWGGNYLGLRRFIQSQRELYGVG